MGKWRRRLRLELLEDVVMTVRSIEAVDRGEILAVVVMEDVCNICGLADIGGGVALDSTEDGGEAYTCSTISGGAESIMEDRGTVTY